MVALVRLEQLAPFPERVLAEELARYPKGARVIWCQEEPGNMGAWSFVAPRIEAVLKAVGMAQTRPVYAGRRPAASPATGLYQQHVKEQATLIEAGDHRAATSRSRRQRRKPSEGSAMTVEIRVPSLGELVTEATVAKWYKQIGDPVAADEPMVELETDKVTLEFNAPASGVLAEIVVEEGGEVEVGALLGSINEERGGRGGRAGRARRSRCGQAGAPREGNGALAPAVRKLLDEHGLDPAHDHAERTQGQHHQGRRARRDRSGAQPATPAGRRGAA